MYKYYKQRELNQEDGGDISSLYDQGFVFTRLGKGIMQQIDSLRIRLVDFDLSSENRRIIKKTHGLDIIHAQLPTMSYSWEIGKLGQDFYRQKFGSNIMSANKIKEMFNDLEKSNMTAYFQYEFDSKPVGYCLLYEDEKIIHYSYPFYSLKADLPNLGIGMMLKAIVWAKENGFEYVYLGSDSKYKHQFKGLEIFNPVSDSWNHA